MNRPKNLKDLEKYCDGLEEDYKKISENLGNEVLLVQATYEDVKRLKKALEKACEILEEGYGQEEARYEYITCDDKYFKIPTNMTAEQWFEWLTTPEGILRRKGY